MNCNNFLVLLLKTTLPLPPGRITKLQHLNTQLYPIYLGQGKVFHLDLLLRIDLSSPDGEPSSHLVNIEMHHCTSLFTVPKFTSYSSALYGSQILKGPEENYAKGTNVYSLVIVRQNLAYYRGSKSYHHIDLRTGSCRAQPPRASYLPGLLGPQYAIIELGKFIKPYDELTTTADKLFYFMKNTDKLTMPLEQVEAYLNDGGPMSVAVTHMIKYSQDEELQRAALKLEYKAQHAQYLDQIKAEGKVEGRAEGKAEGKVEGKAETQLSLAHKLLADGFDHTKIAELTGLP